MLKAKLSGGFQGKEEDIRAEFGEESNNGPQVELRFAGDVVTLISDHEDRPNDWQLDSLKSTFKIALHRVLPKSGEPVWEEI